MPLTLPVTTSASEDFSAASTVTTEPAAVDTFTEKNAPHRLPREGPQEMLVKFLIQHSMVSTATCSVAEEWRLKHAVRQRHHARR